MNDYGKRRCEELSKRRRSNSELQQTMVRRQCMAALCHCSAEIDEGTYLFFSVNDMFLGDGDYVLLLFSENGKTGAVQEERPDPYTRLYKYALIQDAAAECFQGHFTYYASELDGRLVVLIVFHYGLSPALRDGLLAQLCARCEEVSTICRSKYAMDVITYMSGVIERPEDIAAYYHKLLSTTTLHMYMGKTLDEPVFHMTVPAPGTHDPHQTLAKDYPKQIANAIIDNRDFRTPLEEALAEFEDSPHQSVDALKAHFGEFFEAIFENLKQRGLQVDIDRLRYELQSMTISGNEWRESTDWLRRQLEHAETLGISKERLYVKRYLNQAEEYIERHLDDPLLSEREIAEHIGISASYLSALFRRQRQITVTKCIRDLRLKESLELLQKTELPIHEICRICGFGSVETFHRVFKSEYAISPGKLRKLHAVQQPTNG